MKSGLCIALFCALASIVMAPPVALGNYPADYAAIYFTHAWKMEQPGGHSWKLHFQRYQAKNDGIVLLERLDPPGPDLKGTWRQISWGQLELNVPEEKEICYATIWFYSAKRECPGFSWSNVASGTGGSGSRMEAIPPVTSLVTPNDAPPVAASQPAASAPVPASAAVAVAAKPVVPAPATPPAPARAASLDVHILGGRIYQDCEVIGSDEQALTIRYGPSREGVKLPWTWIPADERAALEPRVVVYRLKGRFSTLTREEGDVRAGIASALEAQKLAEGGRRRGYSVRNAPSAGDVSRMKDRLAEIAEEKRQIQQDPNFYK